MSKRMKKSPNKQTLKSANFKLNPKIQSKRTKQQKQEGNDEMNAKK